MWSLFLSPKTELEPLSEDLRNIQSTLKQLLKYYLTQCGNKMGERELFSLQ